MAYHHPIPGTGSGSSSSSGLNFLNSRFGGTTFTKVFVGGLAWETKSETLRRHFEQYGEILEAVVIADKNTGRSKGYGFVTFRDPDSARTACADPCPIIEGRRANCNLALLGRPRPATPYGTYFGSMHVPRGAYVGSSPFHQSVPHGYHQAIPYTPYGYTGYGSSEFVYPQNMYNPYMGQQYVQVYSVPGTVNTPVYPYGQLGQRVPAGHDYTAVQGYTVPGHHFVQLGGPNINGATASGIVAPVPAHPHFIVPAQSAQFMQGSGPDQTAG